MKKQAQVSATGQGIFISYRRDDSAGYAGRLFDNLDLRFGRDRLFRDVDNLKPGVDFVTKIDDALKDCGVLLAVIGTEWLNAQDAQGRRRLDDPTDFLRQEICAAMDRGIPVIPVLVHRASMPGPESLPEPLRPLARHQAVELDDPRWNSDLARLVEVLEPILGEAHSEDGPVHSRGTRKDGQASGGTGAVAGWVRGNKLIALIGAVLIATAATGLTSVLRSGPTAPAIRLSAERVGLLGVKLEWSAPSVPPDLFEVTRDGQVIAEVAAGTLMFVDEDASPGGKHRYVIAAVGRDGGKTESQAATVTLTTPPLGEAGFSGTYLVEATYTSKVNYGDNAKKYGEQWEVSGCAESPCESVRLKITGGEQPGQYFGLSPPTGELIRSGLEYKGRLSSGAFTYCRRVGRDAPNDVGNIEVRITEGGSVNGVWHVAAFEGTVRLLNPAGDGCDLYSYTADLVGKLSS